MTNRFVDRMNRTLLDECFRVKGRTTWYMAPEEIQRDLDVFIGARVIINCQNSHVARRRAVVGGLMLQQRDGRCATRMMPSGM